MAGIHSCSATDQRLFTTTGHITCLIVEVDTIKTMLYSQHPFFVVRLSQLWSRMVCILVVNIVMVPKHNMFLYGTRSPVKAFNELGFESDFTDCDLLSCRFSHLRCSLVQNQAESSSLLLAYLHG